MNLSIIVPVYNIKCYIEQCLYSILNNKMNGVEIIIVDDGSTDGTSEICDYFEKKSSQIRVFHQDNAGVSAARNRGMAESVGEWITFVDADDRVDANFVEILSHLTYNTELVLSGEVYCKRGGIIRQLRYIDKVWNIGDLKCSQIPILDSMTSPHGKLYKKEIIDKYQLRFDEKISCGEDRDFNIEYLMCITKVRTTSYIGYFYNMDVENSLSKQYYNYIFECNIRYWNKMHCFLGDNSVEYQAHRLCNFIMDNFIENKKRHGWISAFREFKRLKPIINSSFLRQNISIVNLPKWQLWLLMIFV